MTTAYFDSSAFVKLLIDEDGSEHAEQIWNEADQKAYSLDSFDKVKPLMGGKVTVKGKLDAATNTITVESAARADEKAKAQ